MTGPGDELSGFAKAYRAAAPWLNASAKLTTAPALGVAVGWFIDSRAGSAPWGLLIGALLGMTVGFVAFIAAVLKASKKEEKK